MAANRPKPDKKKTRREMSVKRPASSSFSSTHGFPPRPNAGFRTPRKGATPTSGSAITKSKWVSLNQQFDFSKFLDETSEMNDNQMRLEDDAPCSSSSILQKKTPSRSAAIPRKPNKKKTGTVSSCQAEGRIAYPPSAKHKGPFTITMPINKLQNGQTRSTTKRAGGLIWRMHVKRTHMFDEDYTLTATIDCDGQDSTKMWRTEAKMQLSFKLAKGSARSFDRLPLLNAKSSIHDAIIMLDGNKISVHKKELSAQSIYFNRLFNGDLKKSKLDVFEIKDTNSEDFDESLKMMFGISSAPITEDNVIRYLTMADKFDLQIAKEQVENSLLSTDIISIHRKLLIAEEYKLEVLKSDVLRLYKKKENLLELRRSKEFEEVPESVKSVLFGYAFDLLGSSTVPNLLSTLLIRCCETR